jgi:hypothetical protein
MLNYLRNYYDSFREAAASSAIAYNMDTTDEDVKRLMEYCSKTGDEKEIREIVDEYCRAVNSEQDIEYNTPDMQKVKDMLFMPERIQGRMPIVEDIVSESVFKAFIYYQLINALVGTSVSNTTHYIVSLEPFTEHIPNLPLLVKLNFDDMQKELFAAVAGTDRYERYEKVMREYPNTFLTAGGFSIYRDFLPIKSLSVEYEDIETASIEIFGHSFSLPGSWNSLKPQVSLEVHDFAGRPFARYMQTYRKLVFRNNGTWPILHMAFILDIVGIDNTLTITDLMSLLVVPRSINIPAIDYDSSEDFTAPQPVKIDFEVIGFIDYVDTALINGAAVGKFNVIDHISFNRMADPNNILSNWYHTQNFNPAPAKYPLYCRNYNKHLSFRDIRKCRLTKIRMRTGRTAHLVEGDPQIRNIKVFEPEIGGRSTDWAYKPQDKK